MEKGASGPGTATKFLSGASNELVSMAGSAPTREGGKLVIDRVAAAYWINLRRLLWIETDGSSTNAAASSSDVHWDVALQKSQQSSWDCPYVTIAFFLISSLCRICVGVMGVGEQNDSVRRHEAEAVATMAIARMDGIFLW